MNIICRIASLLRRGKTDDRQFELALCCYAATLYTTKISSGMQNFLSQFSEAEKNNYAQRLASVVLKNYNEEKCDGYFISISETR